MSHTGSLLILATGIYAWRPKSIHDLTADDFSRILGEAEPANFLILGTGKTLLPTPVALRELFARGHGYGCGGQDLQHTAGGRPASRRCAHRRRLTDARRLFADRALP